MKTYQQPSSGNGNLLVHFDKIHKVILIMISRNVY